jgi:ribosomal protein S4
VNGKKTTVPSYAVAVQDAITIRPESRASKLFEDVHVRLKQQEAPSWLAVNSETLTGTCVKSARESDEQFPFNIDLVGEFYSR